MIEWDRIRILQKEVGPDDLTEVIDLFFEEIEEAIADLPNVKEPQSLAEALHFLKNGALNMGFRHLSELCQAGEKSAAQGRADWVDIAEVLEIYATSKKQFLSELPDLARA